MSLPLPPLKTSSPASRSVRSADRAAGALCGARLSLRPVPGVSGQGWAAGWAAVPAPATDTSAALGHSGAFSQGTSSLVLSYSAWTLGVLSECRPGCCCRNSRSTGNESKGKGSYELGEGFMTSGVRVSLFFSFSFFHAALRFSVILFGYIKYFHRLSWSLSWWAVRSVERGESLAGWKRRSLAAAITAVSQDRSADCAACLWSALGSSGSELRRVWKADSWEMDTPSPPEREHVREGAGAREGLSKQPLWGEDSTQTCCEVMR